MDMTQDFQTRIHDNFARKSMGRRVSFSEHAYVRVFEKTQTTPTAQEHLSHLQERLHQRAMSCLLLSVMRTPTPVHPVVEVHFDNRLPVKGLTWTLPQSRGIGAFG